MSSLKTRPLREDLITQACLEAYGAVRHDGRLASVQLPVLAHARGARAYAAHRRVGSLSRAQDALHESRDRRLPDDDAVRCKERHG